MSAVVAFLIEDGVDGAGRTFDQVLAFNDAMLERRHDFIQWLFPLTEPSAAVPGSPVLSARDVEALRISPVARERLARAAERMLRFYAATDGWRAPVDHNHLRITRIIRSLRLLCGDASAEAFRERISALAEGEPISAHSRSYWASA
jgi:predicted secreted protein